MRNSRQRLLWFLALAALLAVFAGCKSESSPTAPPVGNGGTGGAGNPPGGGVTPPSGATLNLTVSNPNPLIDSVSTITATVTLNNQPVVNGTAVEFNTNLGVFTDTQDVRTIRTTTNGVASAVITSPDPGVATISATVNNVTRTVQVTFSEAPPGPPPPPSTNPTIVSVTPNTGPPAGGTVITITGTNFRAPARVIVDAGPAGSKEAFVQSVTPTQIVAVTPAINLASTQTQAAAITVIVDAGSPAEQRVTRAGAFTYVTTNLTPVIRALSPTSGPIDGGTRVTIIGDAFEQPVQVFFGAAQAQVISVNFNQIIVMSPTARDTAPNGSGAVTGFVDIKVVNVNSGKSAALTGTSGFRYTPKMQITLAGPNEGPFTGGTRFTIDGTGFNEPLTVVTAGVAAQVIKVTGTQIIAISNPVQPTTCADVTGNIVVTNGDNGDTAIGPPWIYRILKPTLAGTINPNPVNAGETVAIPVFNAIGTPVFTIGGVAAPVIGSVFNPTTGVTTFTVQVPRGVTFTSGACPGISAVQAPQPTPFDIVFTSAETTCTFTAAKSITVNPVTPVLAISPTSGFTNFTATAQNLTSDPPIAFRPSTPQTVLFVNGGGGTLTVNGFSTAGPGCSNFTISTGATPSTLTECDPFPISAQYTPPASSPPGTFNTCTITINTSLGNKTFILSGSVQ